MFGTDGRMRMARHQREELTMELDSVLLSRIRFGFVVSFQIIFPSFNIGLAAWLATIEAREIIGKLSRDMLTLAAPRNWT
jgi:hypothetical protein